MDYDRIFRDLEMFVHLFSTSKEDVVNGNLEKQSLWDKISSLKDQNCNLEVQIQELNDNLIQSQKCQESEKKNFEWENSKLKKTIEEMEVKMEKMNKIMNEINMKRKYKFDDESEYTPEQIADKVLKHDLIMKALNDKVKLVTNYINNIHVIKFDKDA